MHNNGTLHKCQVGYSHDDQEEKLAVNWKVSAEITHLFFFRLLDRDSNQNE